jgi:hypothetical protein
MNGGQRTLASPVIKERAATRKLATVVASWGLRTRQLRPTYVGLETTGLSLSPGGLNNMARVQHPSEQL